MPYALKTDLISCRGGGALAMINGFIDIDGSRIGSIVIHFIFFFQNLLFYNLFFYNLFIYNLFLEIILLEIIFKLVFSYTNYNSIHHKLMVD